MEIKSWEDLKEREEEVEAEGRKEAISTESVREYVRIYREFVRDALRYITEGEDFILIEASNGVVGFDPSGKEIFREIPSDMDWEMRFIKLCYPG